MLSEYCKHLNILDEEFGGVNAAECNIRIIDNQRQTVKFIVSLCLDRNHLLSLTGIEQFHNLELLHLNYNHISLPQEFNKIRNAFFMKSMSFRANPVEYHPEVTLKALKQKGFTRLTYCNQAAKHEYIKRTTPEWQSAQKTARMEQSLNSSACKTKRNSGRITIPTHSYRRTKNTKDTEELSENENEHTAVHPFENIEEQSLDIEVEHPNAMLEFIEEQKHYLAYSFYLRSLLERSFKTLKKNAFSGETDQLKREILFNKMELMRWALLRIRLAPK